MEHLPKKTCQNGISYTLVGDYYIPDLQLPEENRPIGIWGRMHKAYLELYHPARYNDLILSGKLWTYLVDLNEQAQNRLDYIIIQMKEAEGVTEELKARDQMAWVRAMNSIRYATMYSYRRQKKLSEQKLSIVEKNNIFHGTPNKGHPALDAL